MTSLRTDGLLTVISKSLDTFLGSLSANWWPTASVVPFPSVDSTEATTSQHYVSARISDISRCQGRVHRKKTLRLPGTPKYVRSTTSVIFESQPADAHSVISFCGRRPDIVCYYGEGRGGSAITIVGDVKGCGRRNKDFSEEEVGHILGIGTDLLKKPQFTRTVLYRFLTDGFRFQYFRCNRNPHSNDISYEQSSVYGGESGWQV